jgi:hypothetical protein
MPKTKTKGRSGRAVRNMRRAASTGIAAGLTSIVSLYVPSFLSLFVEQRELLFLFTALLACLLIALHACAEKVALWNDNFIDRFEAFNLDWLKMFGMLAMFASFQYAGQILIDYFLAGPILLPNLLLILVILLVVVLNQVPFFKDTVLLWGETNGDDV